MKKGLVLKGSVLSLVCHLGKGFLNDTRMVYLFVKMSDVFGYTQIMMLVVFYFFTSRSFTSNHSGWFILLKHHFIAGKEKHSLVCWFAAFDNGYSHCCMFEELDKGNSHSELSWVPCSQLYLFFCLQQGTTQGCYLCMDHPVSLCYTYSFIFLFEL